MDLAIQKPYTIKSKPLSLKYDYVFFLMVFAFGGFFGFFYETLFYWIDLGYITKRGMTFGPWIPIYGFGGILLILLTEKTREKPLLLFILSTLICGFLEYLTGYILYNSFNVRFWNYNTEIWNWGNIGGFVCLRSLIFFGLSALFLQYFIRPVFEYIANKITKKILRFLLILPGILFSIDIIISSLIFYSNLI